MSHAETDQLTETFKRALDSILARVFVCASQPPVSSMAIGYSGGLDSSVLLHLARDYADDHGIRLHAFHVHHGLSANADAWLAHCQLVCEKLQIAFDSRKVLVAKEDGMGMEAAARMARYAALGEMCREHRASLLLTAHHQDDQVETVLLQMLRGAGLAGMSGMDEVNSAPDLLGDTAPLIARPLLSVPRAELAAFAEKLGIAHIEDESNLNLHHPRNALRKKVLPVLATHFPAYRDCLVRGAQHAQAAQRLLNELAIQDMAACADTQGWDEARDDGSVAGLKASLLESMSKDRAANLLRHWLLEQGMRPPSTAWLDEALAQLLHSREDSQACVILDGQAVRCYRDRIVITSVRAHTHVEPIVFRWQGETSLSFPGFTGNLHLDMVERGLDPAWLRGQSLRLQYRAGSTQSKPNPKLKLQSNRPAKALKEWYQERAIPAWERPQLPLVYAGDTLLFAAGIGQDCRLPEASPGVVLRWFGN
ncbi:MAG: tRNA lysidine(34) synthetase TilS [Oxalobacter sp.]|nr:MAG: tRNA lysidine(34) synthetase TilS [Oxalobacter sp.]